jgi:hypothetical protein
MTIFPNPSVYLHVQCIQYMQPTPTSMLIAQTRRGTTLESQVVMVVPLLDQEGNLEVDGHHSVAGGRWAGAWQHCRVPGARGVARIRCGGRTPLMHQGRTSVLCHAMPIRNRWLLVSEIGLSCLRSTKANDKFDLVRAGDIVYWKTSEMRGRRNRERVESSRGSRRI